MVTGDLSTLVKNRLERFCDELPLASFPDILRDLAPHVGDENDALQGRVTTKFAEHLEVTHRDLRESLVGNAVDVDNSGEF